MPIYIWNSPALWLTILGGGIIFILLAIYWRRSFKRDPNPVEFLAEAFRNPINSSITVAGLVIPLSSSIIVFMYGKTDFSLEKLGTLFSSLLILGSSTLNRGHEHQRLIKR